MAGGDSVKQERMHLRRDTLLDHKHEILTLKDANWAVILDALENPPRPNAKFEQPFTGHRERAQR